MDLPTEAQWEYAARSAGKPLRHATDNGTLEPGRNISEANDPALARYGNDLDIPEPVSYTHLTLPTIYSV